ncbi:hypothetical protein [Burkholderia diffusa]|uniref:hypothetical protein n=1 Tax=Burkholderia diffusa TaxID=488732 RepID=UPI0012DB77E7|nr:hypothetical protein [Burkholderia diffusa]
MNRFNDEMRADHFPLFHCGTTGRAWFMNKRVNAREIIAAALQFDDFYSTFRYAAHSAFVN